MANGEWELKAESGKRKAEQETRNVERGTWN